MPNMHSCQWSSAGKEKIKGPFWTSQAFADTIMPVSTRLQMPPELKKRDILLFA